MVCNQISNFVEAHLTKRPHATLSSLCLRPWAVEGVEAVLGKSGAEPEEERRAERMPEVRAISWPAPIQMIHMRDPMGGPPLRGNQK
jgi:hypothetical protein